MARDSNGRPYDRNVKIQYDKLGVVLSLFLLKFHNAKFEFHFRLTDKQDYKPTNDGHADIIVL